MNWVRGILWPVVESTDRRFKGVVLKKLPTRLVLPANDVLT